MSMEHVIVIAEAGVNYNGDIELAKQMVRVAAKAGADIVKFQTGKPENSISVYAKKADYQARQTGNEESQLDMCRKLMLPENVYPELIKECRNFGIEFLSTPFDKESVDLLSGLGVHLWKIPSGEITDLPLLEYIAGKGEPIILSTGMSTMDEIRSAIELLRDKGAGELTVLQCNTEYPTPMSDANVRAMKSIADEFNVKVGYSDHTKGIVAPILAVALGASIIEKHFTLDKTMEGPDQAASMEPAELREFIKAVRDAEVALGNGIKTPSGSELKNKDIARKSIVAAKAIKRGDMFTEKNLTCKRPGDGISPMLWYDVIGKLAGRDFSLDEQIELL